MEEKKDRLAWWREARFGMFIHFGLYSALEGSWNGEEEKGIGEWIQARKKIPLADYRTYAPKLTLEKFDAKEYVRLAKAAGMKYIVFTSKHHEGFAMYDSAYSDYNVVNMGPSHRDPAKELAEAAREAGIKLCFYYSQALDWEDPDGVGNDWDYDPEKKDVQRFIDGKCKHQLKEILTNYGDLGLIWFDVPRGINRKQSEEIRDYVKSIQPDCLVSGRISYEPGVGDYGSLGDNEIPAGKVLGDWETPATLNHTWGYKKNDNNWKAPETLIRQLIELLSKGVNYLLNIGPKPDGAIPEESILILEEMGKWVHLNEEAVYGTSCTPFSIDFNWGRAAVKENCLYLYLFEKMTHLELAGIRNQVKRAVLIGEEKKEVAFEQFHEEASDNHLLKLTIPASENPYQDVIRLELDGAPDVKEGAYQQPDHTVPLPAHLAEVSLESHGEARTEAAETDVAKQAESFNIADMGPGIDANGILSGWKSESGSVLWKFRIYRPGEYKVLLQTRSAKYQPWRGGHRVRVQCGEWKAEKVLTADREVPEANTFYFDEKISEIGSLQLLPGEYSLQLELVNYNQEDTAGLCVAGVKLE